MNFVEASKKRINPSAKENEKIWVKMFSNFWTTGILKELVITVGNEPTLINTFCHYGIVDAPFCPGYYESSAPKKKKLIAERRKVVQGIFWGGCFLTSNFGPIFDLLNDIIWTSSPAGNLFKIKFSSQGSLNNAIFMDGLKITG